MSKIDQLRLQREAQHARQQEGPAAEPRAKVAPAPPSSPKVAEPSPSPERVRSASADAEGRCSVCNKVRALQNGLVSNHQKGLGKMCPGSRKEPA